MPYLAGLDGLRALAVVAVVLYHALDIQGLPSALRPEGGFLGVEVFFVISGYLITALLLGEQNRTGTIDLKDFWIRRARRLLPALFVFLGGAIALAALLADDALAKIRSEIVGALLYFTNWLLIVRDESYFEAAGRPSLLRHLWSLAIEEQFYLVWPLVVWGGLRLFGRRGLFVLTLVGVAASTALMWMLFDGVPLYGDVTTIYYRTDARAAALLIGAAAAMVWRPWESGQTASLRRFGRTRVVGREAIGVASLGVVLAAQYWFTDNVVRWDRYETLYQGGFLAVSGATVLLIGSVACPGSRIGAALGNPLFRWIGARSYGLYLWHWPVFQLTRPRVDIDLDGWRLLGLRLGITLVLVELSYRLIEVPLRERRLWSTMRNQVRRPVASVGWIAGAVGAVGLVGAGLTLPPQPQSSGQTEVAGLVELPEPVLVEAAPTSPPAKEGRSISARSEGSASVALPLDQADATTPVVLGPEARSRDRLPNAARPTPTPVYVPDLSTLDLPSAAEAAPSGTPDGPAPPVEGRVLVFGDSVMLGATPNLALLGSEVFVDARIGRQWWEAPAEIGAHVTAESDDEAQPGNPDDHEAGVDYLVIHLGNNGPMNDAMFDAAMTAAGDTPVVVFVTVRAPRRWEGETNAVIAAGVERWGPQARLADWYRAANDRPEYFDGDGIHLTLAGRTAISDLVGHTLNEAPPAN